MGVSKIYKASASWCGPCRSLKKELKDFTLVPIEEIDVDEDEDFCEKYEIKSVPTLIYVDENDNDIGRHIGFLTQNDLIKEIDEINKQFS